MSIKIVNCDCRAPGCPRHTHSHYGRVPPPPPFPTRRDKYPPSPTASGGGWGPVIGWSIVVFLLVLLSAWLKYKGIELEAP
jgi:hypothetical protein